MWILSSIGVCEGMSGNVQKAVLATIKCSKESIPFKVSPLTCKLLILASTGVCEGMPGNVRTAVLATIKCSKESTSFKMSPLN